MTRPNKRHSDPFETHLLRLLATLLDERSVSRAAVRLNMSQPAVSTALKRLREIFGDALLIKDKQRMVPTERARQIEGSVRHLLQEVDLLLAPPPAFDPAHTRLHFRVGTPDYLAPGYTAAMVGYLRRHAPGARLVLQPLGADYDYEAALAEGELDVVIGNWPQPPEHLRLGLLLEDDVVCLVDRNHPATGPGGMSLAQYAEGAHVVPAPYSVLQRGVVETHLNYLRLAREATVTTPFFALAPALLVGTDLIFTTARHFAEHYARQLPLAVVAPPITFPRMRFYMLWHTATHYSPAQSWLRSVMAGVARTEGSTRAWAAGSPATPATEMLSAAGPSRNQGARRSRTQAAASERR
jgi:DNA-binding transcriptional LysR family regulator